MHLRSWSSSKVKCRGISCSTSPLSAIREFMDRSRRAGIGQWHEYGHVSCNKYRDCERVCTESDTVSVYVQRLWACVYRDCERVCIETVSVCVQRLWACMYRDCERVCTETVSVYVQRLWACRLWACVYRVCQLVWLLGISARLAWVCKPVGLMPRRQNERATFRAAGSLYLSVEDHLARVTLVYSVLLMHFSVFFNTDLQY